MLVVTLLVMAAPPFGGDFGAAIAGAPGFGLFAWLLLGRTIRLRTVVILGGVLVVAGPARRASPTSCARATSRPTSAASSTSWSTARPATRSSPSGARSTPTSRRSAAPSCCGCCPSSRVLVWYLWRVHGGRIRPLFRSVPVIRQTMLALAVVAVLGYALNDSGVAIPAVMALVFECALVFVALTPIVRTGVDGGATTRLR